MSVGYHPYPFGPDRSPLDLGRHIRAGASNWKSVKGDIVTPLLDSRVHIKNGCCFLYGLKIVRRAGLNTSIDSIFTSLGLSIDIGYSNLEVSVRLSVKI